MSCCLYRHFDKSDKLLYVGISMSLAERTSAHKSSSRWFDRVRKITVEHFETRELAVEAERKAIRAEDPKFNIYGVVARLSDEKKKAKFSQIVTDLRKAGMTHKQIAKECECSEGYMCQLGLGNKKEPGYHIGRRLVQLHLGRT